MGEITLSEIWQHPVKSLRGLPLQRAELEAKGLAGDRRWMLVDGNGRFITQREQSRLSLVDALPQDGALAFAAPGMPPLTTASPPEGGERLAVTIWRDPCEAVAPSAEADHWFSDYLGQACRLVYLPDDSLRPVDPDYARPGEQVGFADGFPLLLISQGSLDDLNSRLETPLPMRRFRPNLVVSGCEPHAEDGWRRIRIGETTFRVVKPCSRCIIPTIDPATGERSPEPLRTLAGYRRRDNRIYFGQNLVHEGNGILEVGMAVELLP